MDSGIRYGLLIGLLAAGATAPPLAAQAADSLPEGVTQAMVTRGKAVWSGAGLCVACHGPAGKGGIGPDLTDGEWLHHDGSYDALVKQITAGVPLNEAKTGQMMPPRGGGAINDADLRAVAAYVWTLSRRPPRS